METLELESWEMLPGCTEPRRAFVHGRSERSGVTALLRIVRFAPGRFGMFVRLHERNYLLLREGAPQIWKRKPIGIKLGRIADSIWPRGSLSLASVYVVRDLQNGRDVVALEGANVENWSQTRRGFSWVDDRFENPLRFHDENVPDAASFLAAQLNTPNSFARWLWNWLQASTEQRQWLWQEQQTKREKMEQLMTQVLWCLPELWQQAEEVQLAYNHSGAGNNWVYKRQPSPREYIRLNLPESFDFIARWGAELNQRFVPFHHLHLLELNRKFSTETARFGSVVVAPTMHEQIEARLKLREWLEQNAPEKIGALLAS